MNVPSQLLAPLILRLPREILADILSLALNLLEGWQFRDSMNLVAVCRAFRDVMVANSKFWPALHGGEPRNLSEAILARNKTGPLAIYAGRCMCISEIEGLFELALPHRQRWNAVTVASEDGMEYVWDVLSSALCYPTPSLVTLDLSNMNDIATTVIHISELGSGPPFQNITLNWVSLPWSSGRLRDIRNLRLYFGSAGGRPTLTQLVHILHQSPQLNSLHICFNDNQPEAPPKYEIIYLPQLTWFCLEELTAANAGFLVSRLSSNICRAYTVAQHICSSLFDPGKGVHLLHTLRPILKDLISLDMVYTSSSKSLYLKGVSRLCPYWIGLNISILLKGRCSFTSWKNTCAFLNSSINPQAQIRLTVDSTQLFHPLDTPFPSDDLLGLLAHFNAIQSLCLRGWGIEPFLATFCPEDPEDSHFHLKGITEYLPRLRILDLDEIEDLDPEKTGAFASKFIEVILQFRNDDLDRQTTYPRISTFVIWGPEIMLNNITLPATYLDTAIKKIIKVPPTGFLEDEACTEWDDLIKLEEQQESQAKLYNDMGAMSLA